MSKAARRLLMIVIAADVLILVAMLGTLLFFGGLYAFTLANAIDSHNPQTQEDMLQTTLEWGRLAPLPDNSSDFDIQAEGSPFTREFNCSFVTDRESLDAWIQVCPGLQDADITGGQTKTYDITPGGGAQFAQVVIDFDACTVRIHVYWS